MLVLACFVSLLIDEACEWRLCLPPFVQRQYGACFILCLLVSFACLPAQAHLKKRDRQVGEAQGSVVLAQAQVSSLEQQIQELQAAHKQVCLLRLMYLLLLP